jgi:signal transduction histidine kinase
VIAIQAEAAPYKTADPPPELVESFGDIRSSALAGLAELRRVLGVLRTGEPSLTPQPGLAELDVLLDGARSAGVSVTVTSSGDPVPLPEGVDLSAYRILQEALSNAMRHAPGSQVLLHMAYFADGLGLEVRNDAGQRTAPILVTNGERAAGGGNGLIGMRERAAMLGGSLDAGPTEDGGFQVVAVLPMIRKDEP